MSPNNPSLPVTHNTALQRFEVHADGLLAFLSYTNEGTTAVMDHTYLSWVTFAAALNFALWRLNPV